MDITLIATETIDEINMSAATIKDEVEAVVENHLLSEHMKNLIGANTLESFTIVCDSKTPDSVDRLGKTAKNILKDDTWLKTHDKSIAGKIITIEKANIQEIVNQTALSPTTQKLIDGMAKRPIINMLL